MRQLIQNIRARKPNAFDHLVTAVILLAGILIGLETNPSLHARHGELFRRLDLALLVFFAAEIAFKLAIEGRRPWRYFLDPDQVAEDRAHGCGPRAAWIDAWHCFDFAIVALCLLPHILPLHMHSEFLPMVRIARILRLLRLAEEIPKLHVLVNALLKSLPSITYICIFLLLHFYSYAVAGTFLFGAQDGDHYGSISRAMLTLFEVVTGNGFSPLMRDAMARAATAGYASSTPVIYYTTFVIIGVTIILNLFVGVIISEMAVLQKALDERQRAQCDERAKRAAAARGESAAASTDPATERSLDLAALESQLAAMQALLARIRERNPTT